MKKIGFIIVLAMITEAIKAQISGEVMYRSEIAALASSNNRSPFWLTSNRYGMGSVERYNGSIRAGAKGLLYLPKHWTLEVGLDLAAGWQMTSKLWLQQCYLDVSWKKLRLSIGNKERAGFPLEKNQSLTSGWSMEGINTRPIPQLRVEIKEYLPIKWLKNWLSLKGHIAYGKFMDSDWKEKFVEIGRQFSSDVLYHSKSVLFRIGNQERFPLEFEFGLQMATQFGGKIYKKLGNGSKELIRKMPTDLGAFTAAFFPMHGGDDTIRGEQTNVEGNMLGAWNFGFNFYLNDWTFRIHYDHFFEDHSQMFWEYGRWKDGQLGIEVNLPNNRWVSSILWEGINTTDQSGSVYYDAFDGTMTDAQTSGTDNYYNHGIYDSWQYYGMTMGNPLLFGPIYNEDHSLKFKSNRIRAQHIGISGNPTKEWQLRVLATYSQHWGTYGAPLDKVRKQFNGMIEINYMPKWCNGLNIIGALALDNGNYLGNCVGGMVTVRKTGSWTFIR